MSEVGALPFKSIIFGASRKVLNVLNRFFKNVLKYGASSKKLQNFHISPVLLTHSHRDVHQMNQILHIWRCVDSSGVAWTALTLRMQLWRCVGSSDVAWAALVGVTVGITRWASRGGSLCRGSPQHFHGALCA